MPRSRSNSGSGEGAKLLSKVLDDPKSFNVGPGLKKGPPPPPPPKPNKFKPFNETDEMRLRQYTGGGFKQVNPHLRDPNTTIKPMRKKFGEKADGVSEALHKLPSEPGKTYRSADFSGQGGPGKFYREGETVKESAFTSTSKNPDIDKNSNFRGDTKFNINGRNGKNVTDYSPHDEEEILFDKGTEFKVDKVTPNGKITNIDLTEV